MSRSLRGLRAAVAAAVVGLLATGCLGAAPDDVTTRVDRDRVRLLESEPVLADVQQPLRTDAARVRGGSRGWDRGQVRGMLFWYERGRDIPPTGEFQQRVAGVLGTLRDSGWTVLWTECKATARWDAQHTDSGYWQWIATGYKVVDGVSYGFRLQSTLERPKTGGAVIVLLAPNHRDPDNLFADAPVGPGPGSTCVERGGVDVDAAPAEDQLLASGTRIEVASTRTWPRDGRSPDQSLR